MSFFQSAQHSSVLEKSTILPSLPRQTLRMTFIDGVLFFLLWTARKKKLLALGKGKEPLPPLPRVLSTVFLLEFHLLAACVLPSRVLPQVEQCLGFYAFAVSSRR